ncbi:ABC transporter permease [Naumannella huperziae]
MTLDLSPAPGAAPPARRIARHARTEALLLARNGEQLLLAAVIPAATLVGGAIAGPRLGIGLDALAPSVLALAIWSTAFTSCAIATGFDRRYQVLERLAASPLRRSGLVAGKAAAIVIIVLAQVALLAAVAALLGWRPALAPAAACSAALAVLAAVCAFVAGALILAGTLRAELTLACANLLYLAGLFAGILPVGGAGWLGAVRWLPTGALGEALRAAGAGRPDWLAVATLVAWAIVLTMIARRVFRWTS